MFEEDKTDYNVVFEGITITCNINITNFTKVILY